MIPAGRRLHRRRQPALFTLFTQTWSSTDGH
jgi:hypothetical protein